MTAEKADEVWNQIQAQAAYLFNRSHAVAYSMLTYQTARLRVMYPLEYIAALMRTVLPTSDMAKEKRESYLSEAIRIGFKIMPPDVNISDDRFVPNGKDELLFGLADIKGVGVAAVRRLLAYRAKKKKFELPSNVDYAANNAGVFNALCAAGALRSLGVDPDTEQQEELLRWQFEDRMTSFREEYKKRVVLPAKAKNGKVSIIGEIRKIEKRTTKTGKTFYQWTLRYAPGEEFRISVWDSAQSLFPLLPGSIVIVSGKWNATYRNVGVDDASDVDLIRRITTKSIEKAKKEKAA